MDPITQIVCKDNPAALAQSGARLFEAAAASAVGERGRFVAALSGGATPRTMHRTLAQKPFCSSIAWDKTHIFWVDERCVSVNSLSSNYGIAKSDLLSRVPIPSGQIHAMPGSVPPKQGALEYQEELEGFFHLEEGQLPVFDLILLGMGKDGHTASLFPGHEALNEKTRLIVAVKGGNPRVSRLTMTLPVLNMARQVVFLISGAEKAETLRRALKEEKAKLPVKRVRPLKGELIWLLDKQAASLLPKGMIHE